MRPLRQRVLCQQIVTVEHMPNGSLIVPQEVREKMVSCQAEVVEVGDGCDPALKSGDWILHKDFARCYVGVEDYFTLLEDDVLAVLEVE